MLQNSTDFDKNVAQNINLPKTVKHDHAFSGLGDWLVRKWELFEAFEKKCKPS